MSIFRRYVLASIPLCSLVLPLGLLAEIDPRKDSDGEAKKPRAELDKGEGEGHEDYHRRVVKEGEENLKEIQRLLDEIEKNLAQKKTDPATQAKQKQVVERMNKLIEEIGKQCSECSSSSSSSSSKKDQASQKQKESSSKKQKAEDEEESKKKSAEEKMQAQREKPESEKESKGKVDNDRVQDDVPPDAKVGALREELRERARWGLLPPKLAEEMLLSTGKDLPPEYREFISKYYKRMNDQYRRSPQPASTK